MKPLAVAQLERWFKRNARQLPWRRTLDPYAIWVSEVMLQQTQVATVIPYYERFLNRFPTLRSLASSREEEVTALWSGLGYYSRARNLRKGAQFLLAEYSGAFPQDRESLLRAPGIGPYTAGAILSIAFDLPVPIVDGNVARFFARYYALRKPIPQLQDILWRHAEDWVRVATSPRALNQAMMELGSLICTKGTPACDRCPLQSSCRAFALSLQTKLPKPVLRKATQELHWASLVIEKKGQYLLTQNGPEDWWQGFWDLPRKEFSSAKEVERFAKGLQKDPLVIEVNPLTQKKHTVTHHRLHVTGLHLRVKQWSKTGRWFSKDEIANLAVSSLFRKVWRELEA